MFEKILHRKVLKAISHRVCALRSHLQRVSGHMYDEFPLHGDLQLQRDVSLTDVCRQLPVGVGHARETGEVRDRVVALRGRLLRGIKTKMFSKMFTRRFPLSIYLTSPPVYGSLRGLSSITNQTSIPSRRPLSSPFCIWALES